jgi:hypothetical protein
MVILLGLFLTLSMRRRERATSPAAVIAEAR